MNQLWNVILINAKIEKNKEKIMTKFQRDNIWAFDFGRSPPLSNPTHPLFGKIPPPIAPNDLNHILYIPCEEYKPIMPEAMDRNIPSTQLGAHIPQNNQSTITQYLVHTTPCQLILTQATLPFTSIIAIASPQPIPIPLRFPSPPTSQIITFTPYIPISSAFNKP